MRITFFFSRDFLIGILLSFLRDLRKMMLWFKKNSHFGCKGTSILPVSWIHRTNVKVSKASHHPDPSSGIAYHTNARRKAQKKCLSRITGSIHNVCSAEFIFFEHPDGVGAISLPKPNRVSHGKKNVIPITSWKCCKGRCIYVKYDV